MLRRAALLFTVLLVACQRPPYADTRPPPSAYRHFKDQFAAWMISSGVPWRNPCTKTKKVSGAVATVTSVPDDQCYKMEPPKRLRGIWFFDDGGDWLCAATAKSCSYESAPYVADFEVKMPDAFWRKLCPGDLYEIDFIGRQTNYPHDLKQKGIVAVQQVIAIKQIGGPACTKNEGPLK